MTNVYAVHFSKSLWGDPQNFRPERFLNSCGTAVDKKMADSLASFGAGLLCHIDNFISILSYQVICTYFKKYFCAN